MDYSQWTTFPEDLLDDGIWLIAMYTRFANTFALSRLTIRTGVVIDQETVQVIAGHDMPDFVGEDEMELRQFILNNEDGVEEYNIKKEA